MVKLAAPCLSLEASGTIGDSVTFSRWKGRSYARRRVIPANPQSALQVSIRAMMRFLSQAWVDVGATPKASWLELATAAKVSGFNSFVRENMQRWRMFNAPSQTYPADESGTHAAATLDSATAGERCIDLTFTITTLNDAWGVILFRSPTGTFATALANAIRVIPVTTDGTLVYTDTDLDAGDYYYDARFITKEGALGPEEGEVNATVT